MEKNRLFRPLALLALAGLLMALGVYRGEPAILLQKAVNICFECMGLG